MIKFFLLKAWEIISNKAESKCSKRVIKDDVLEFLDDDDRNELKAIEREFDVSLMSPDDEKQGKFIRKNFKF